MRSPPSPRLSPSYCLLTRAFLGVDINIPIFIVLFVGWKVAKRTQFWKPHEMDFVTGIPTVEETEVPEVPPVTLAQKIAAVLF